MYATKLTLSEEFKSKANKKLSSKEKGRIMRQRLIDAEADGRLQKATNRTQVGFIAGSTDAKRAYGYTTNQIFSGFITETFRGYENGQRVNEYHVAEVKKKPAPQARELFVDKRLPIVVKKTTEDDKFEACITIDDIDVFLPLVSVDTLTQFIKRMTKE